jgi:hypothetical protein
LIIMNYTIWSFTCKKAPNLKLFKFKIWGFFGFYFFYSF